MIANARLIVTDGTSANTAGINVGAVSLDEWFPKAPEAASTIWASTPYQDGKHLVSKTYDNITDSFTVVIGTKKMDNTIHELRKFIKLLEKAILYWTDEYNTHKYWLEVRGNCETNIRYAYVVNYFIPETNNPYEPPFGSTEGDVAIDELQINIEHTIWTDSLEIGDTAACLKLSSGNLRGHYTEGIFVPVANADDAYVIVTTTTIWTGASANAFGNIAGDTVHTGIRFKALNIPQGAIVRKAYLKGFAEDSLSDVTCSARIYGELNPTPAIFSTYANFIGRALTTALTYWLNIGAFVAGTSYNSPDISAVVQEIVDLPLWASGNDMVIFIRNDGSDNNAYRDFSALESVAYHEVELIVEWEDPNNLELQGEAETCLMAPAVAPLWRDKNLTHAFYYDDSAGTYSANLITDDPAVTDLLLPDPPEVDDCLYFIISNDGLGRITPFWTLAVYISQIAADITGALWEYWDSAAWQPIGSMQYYPDNIARLPAGGLKTGLHLLVWRPYDDWVDTTINGITGMAIRLHVTGVGGAPAAPHRDVTKVPYTISWSHLKVAEDAVYGDISAILNFLIYNQGEQGDHIFISTRKVSRTNNETMVIYLPLNDLVVNSVFSFYNALGGGTEVFSPYAPTGQILQYTAAGPSSDVYCGQFTLDRKTYTGRFRVFLRLKTDLPTTADFVSVHLQVTSILGTYNTKEVYTDYITGNKYKVLDLGMLTFPAEGLEFDNVPGAGIRINVQLSTSDAMTVDLYDLILFPVDESTLEFTLPSGYDMMRTHPIEIITSNPKVGAYGFVGLDYTIPPVGWNIFGDWEGKVSILGTFNLDPEEEYWIIFFVYHPTYTSNIWDMFDLYLQPLIEKKQRYLLMRGDE